jgi:hypothetical protein
VNITHEADMGLYLPSAVLVMTMWTGSGYLAALVSENGLDICMELN